MHLQASDGRFSLSFWFTHNHCENITDAAVIRLAEQCPGLTKVHLYGCGNITNDAIVALETQCASLTTMNVYI